MLYWGAMSQRPPGEPEPFPERLQRLARERGFRSATELGGHAATAQASASSIQKALRGERRLTMQIMEAVAEELGVEPGIFYEYRLAVMRRQLDWRPPPVGVGLENAYAYWERLQGIDES